MSTVNNNLQDLWKQEQAYLEKKKKELPDQFVVSKSHDDLLHWIGIRLSRKALPEGFIKYLPFDFIVEEITRDDEIVTTELNSKETTPEEVGKTVYADLVKINVSMFDILRDMSEALTIPLKDVSYAGIKDALALTGQRISFHGTSKEAVQKLTMTDAFLKNIHTGKGRLIIGNLQGNRFTLFIRTKEKYNEQKLQERIEKINKEGMLNFYGTQRFGSPRYLSHILGKELLRGDFQSAVETTLFTATSFEWPYLQSLRKRAKALYGNWQEMHTLFSELPHTFRTELGLLEGLIEKDKDWKHALGKISDQVRIWTRSYASYVFNTLLSEATQKGITLPETLPLLLSTDRDAYSFYLPLLKKDGTQFFTKHLRTLDANLVPRYASAPTRIYPTFHNYKIFDEGVALSFDLPKGAYATVALEELFAIANTETVPEWVQETVHDTKEDLGAGNVTALLKKYAMYTKRN